MARKLSQKEIEVLRQMSYEEKAELTGDIVSMIYTEGRFDELIESLIEQVGFDPTKNYGTDKQSLH